MPELHDDSGNWKNHDHRREHHKVADRLAHHIHHFRHWRGSQNLADARRTVALDRVLHHVKSRERQKRGGNQRHQPANPRGIENSARVVHAHHQPSRGGCVSQVERNPHGKKKTVAPHAFQEIRASQLVENPAAACPGAVHAATLARWLEMQCR